MKGTKQMELRRLRGRILALAVTAASCLLIWFCAGWRWWPRVEKFPSLAGDFPASFRPAFAAAPPALPSAAEAETLRRQEIALLVDKQHLSPRGDPRDYVSLSIYWWPNPITRLPYLPRDGHRNPEANDYDAPKLRQMVQTVRALAAAGNAECDRRAVEWLRAWFITGETRMHPHLTYAQMMPGLAAGGRQGIIEGLPLSTELLDALAWLEARQVFTAEERRELRRWFGEYLAWILDSRAGRAETARENNHGTWHDVQVAALATSLGLEGLARQVLQAASRRSLVQFSKDGSQPHELRRTKAFAYSLYNLEAWLHLERLGQKHTVPLWPAGPARGLDYLRQHLTDWPREDLHPPTADALHAMEARMRQWQIASGSRTH